MKTPRTAITKPPPGYGPLPSAQMTRRRSHLSAAQATILDALIDQPEPCTVAALSAQIGLHTNTIREHLDRMSAGGMVVRTQAVAEGRGRPAWLYGALRAVGSDQESREYAALAGVLAAQIERTSAHPGADAIEAGRLWGRELVRGSRPGAGEASSAGERPLQQPLGPGADEASGAVVSRSAVAARRTAVTMLDELGFAPSADARVSVVKLWRCPLLEAAHRNPEVVCSVHLGLVRGALDELGADPARTEGIRLQPFSEPGACRLDMFPRSKPAPVFFTEKPQ